MGAFTTCRTADKYGSFSQLPTGAERFFHVIFCSIEDASMTTPSPQEITQLLLAWSDGDQNALARLTPLVYQELRRIAQRYMSREPRGHTLQTTALVNEAYLRLIDASQVQWQNRAHFFAVSANVMRHILVDLARGHQYLKRGGNLQQISLDEALEFSRDRSRDLIELDDALKALAALDPRQSQVVEMKFFGGLNYEEIAEVLKVSPSTVRRDWSLARAWLYRELSKNDA
jgi:RNA polymerase sigma factor (TIGR02999 family)